MENSTAHIYLKTGYFTNKLPKLPGALEILLQAEFASEWLKSPQQIFHWPIIEEFVFYKYCIGADCLFINRGQLTLSSSLLLQQICGSGDNNPCF